MGNSFVLPGGFMHSIQGITKKIQKVRRDFQATRAASVEERFTANRMNFDSQLSRHLELAASRGNGSGGLISDRIDEPQRILIGEETCNADEEDIFTPMDFTKIPRLEKIPRYTTWTYSAKNEMMAEGDSVVGKTIIYQKDGGIETLVCSDSEDETAQARRKRYKFTPEDDEVLRVVEKEYGLTEDVYIILNDQFAGASDFDIPSCIERSKILKIQDAKEANGSEWPIGYLGNPLNQALDSFDILFCRRCLVFDCHLHGCSQPLMQSHEKKPYFENDKNPCGDQCRLLDRSNIAGPSNISKKSHWKTVEKDLVLKGIEMFGRNSCLIARNLLVGLRSCNEVNSYMNEHVRPAIAGSVPEVAKTPAKEGDARKRVVRRKRGSCKLRFSSKAKVLDDSPSKNIGQKDSKLYKDYTPCDCREPLCGPECSCLVREIHCEKYCGCSKNCKNRYRGCYCPKGQCQTQLCPCFVAARECDPDVCRNCWLSCGGDPILGEPPRQGESPCDNMKILRKQQQGILLGRSEVCGWGAFAKNTVEKHEYLGEYTGEVISYREAKKRGKVYNRTNCCSYLFDLNDRYVLDAYRKGDKLKFANHSFEPNCSAKVTFVGSDHRIGIYAEKHIEAGEELFYNYMYPHGVAPPWAQKPGASTEENDSTPQGPAKKHH